MSIYKGSTKIFALGAGANDAQIYLGGEKIFPESIGTISLSVNDSNVVVGTTVTLTASVSGAQSGALIRFQELLPGGSWATFQDGSSATATRVANVNSVKYRAQLYDQYAANPDVSSNQITMSVVNPISPAYVQEVPASSTSGWVFYGSLSPTTGAGPVFGSNYVYARDSASFFIAPLVVSVSRIVNVTPNQFYSFKGNAYITANGSSSNIEQLSIRDVNGTTVLASQNSPSTSAPFNFGVNVGNRSQIMIRASASASGTDPMIVNCGLRNVRVEL